MADMTYHVVVTREEDSWLAEVPGLPGAHTYAGNLIALDTAIREAIALVEDLPEGGEAGLVVDWDFTALDDPAITEALAIAHRRRDVERERHELAEKTRQLAGSFVKRGWSLRDVAGVLGISTGRVSQLVTT
jgi:DNA-directed RNA polymerase specialized sigma subunit